MYSTDQRQGIMRLRFKRGATVFIASIDRGSASFRPRLHLVWTAVGGRVDRVRCCSTRVHVLRETRLFAPLASTCTVHCSGQGSNCAHYYITTVIIIITRRMQRIVARLPSHSQVDYSIPILKILTQLD